MAKEVVNLNLTGSLSFIAVYDMCCKLQSEITT